MLRSLRRGWIPLLLVVIVAMGAYAVVRIRETIGKHQTVNAADANSALTKPFNPKYIVYEITGSAPWVNLDYLDENGQPYRVDAAPLPVAVLPSPPATSVACTAAGAARWSTLTRRTATSPTPLPSRLQLTWNLTAQTHRPRRPFVSRLVSLTSSCHDMCGLY